MNNLLRQSTTVTLKVGPFLDATDGITEETGITPVVEVSKNNGAFGARNSATAITHDAEGWYDVEFDTIDIGTCGRLLIKAQDKTTHLPVWHEFTVVPANVYDALVAGTDKLAVDAQEISSSTTAAIADAILDEAQGDHVAAGSIGKLLDDLKDEAYAGKVVLSPSGDTLTLYKADGVTVLKVFDLTKATGAVPVYIARTPQ